MRLNNTTICRKEKYHSILCIKKQVKRIANCLTLSHFKIFIYFQSKIVFENYVMLEQFMNLWPTTQNLTGTKVEGLNKSYSKEFVQRTRHSS